MTTPKAAIYCRLSEEDRNKQSAADDSSSIRNQKAMLLQYCEEHSWKVFDIYSDDDYTGSDRNRPEFQRLLRDAEQRMFDIVLCKTQSRFTRELELVETYIHGLFPLWGIRFVSIVDNADTENRGNKKSRQINGLVNEWYLEDMSENIRSVLTNRRQNGFHIGAFALYGYRKDPDQKGHLLIDEEAAAIVREVFTLFSQGYGKTAIARSLNERGIPNPTEYKRLHGLRYQQPKNRTSTLWKYPAIAAMLTNEIYIGHMVQGKYGSISYKSKQSRPRPKEQWYRVENTHEAIIDRNLWDRVQSILQSRSRPFQNGIIGLFAGKVRCADCGYTMRSSKNRGRHYLRCSTRYAAKDACRGAFISVENLETLVLQELERLTEAYLDRNVLLQEIRLQDDIEAKKRCIQADIAACKKKLSEYKAGLCSLYLDKAKGIISEDEYSAFSKDFSAHKSHLESAIEKAGQQLAALDIPASEGDIPEHYIHPNRLTREMTEILIDHITVGKRLPEEASPSIEIYWNF